jgi:hypothetical protein
MSVFGIVVEGQRDVAVYPVSHNPKWRGHVAAFRRSLRGLWDG